MRLVDTYSVADGHDALATVLGAVDLDRLRGGLFNGHGLASHLTRDTQNKSRCESTRAHTVCYWSSV